MDLDRQKFSTTVAGKELIFEVSKIAEQANAAVIGQYGDTVVLATAVMGKKDSDVDYLPLTVDYEEKFYAAGKILGSRFMRREGKASNEAVLSGRLIDRVIRPLFDHSIHRDIQIVITILSIDSENDPDFVALMATSLALSISDIPWNGPVAGVRVSKTGDKTLINTEVSQLKDGFEFDGFAAGPENKINMIELEGVNADEKDVLEAFKSAQKEINKLINFQKDITAKLGKKKADIIAFQAEAGLEEKIKKFLEGRLEPALYISDKQKSDDDITSLNRELMEFLEKEGASEKDKAVANHIFESSLDEIVHQNVIEKDRRVDGRKLDEVRELYSEAGLFKRNHGSALFVRGSTQALAVTTIAPPDAEQLVETMEAVGKKRFMLHYNFPPYSTGEAGRMRGPGRREIGHGALAEKAVKNMVPLQEEFPYVIRVVSEILSSNGSSSMATVCATSLSLMDAGVPIKQPVAGIAMGLMINEKGDYKILTDIQGPEDHHGDMDFKVAGTTDGVTAIQLDVKIEGLTHEIIEKTLEQSKQARLQILKHITKTLSAPRKEISPYAPVVLVTNINPEKIGLLIGPGGKTINGIIERTGGNIDVEQSGKVFIYADSMEKAQAAKSEVESLTKEYKVGDIVEGKIVKILEFGAIVEFGSADGMIHVSELKNGFVKKVEDVVKVGDFVRAKIIKADNGKIGLSLKNL